MITLGASYLIVKMLRTLLANYMIREDNDKINKPKNTLLVK